MHFEPLFEKADHPVLCAHNSGDGNATADLKSWLSENMSEVKDRLARHGAILFRGFDVDGADGFSACVDVFGQGDTASYVGGNSPRTALGDGVFTSTEFAAEAEISVHNEMSYFQEWPRLIFFYCREPAAAGGQTTLVDCRDLLAAVPSSIVEKYQGRRLHYIRNYLPDSPLGKTWQETFQTEDRDEAEAAITASGSEFVWLEGGRLKTWSTGDCIINHPDSGDPLWFNQAEQWHASALDDDIREILLITQGEDAFPHDCRFENGETLDEDELTAIRTAQRECYLLFDWQKDDFLMVDNARIMHGRQPFTGDRSVLVSMV